jgi:energy-coupling factor transporter ATP-binding protein EcfA2
MTTASDRPREVSRDVAIYNPDLLRKEELIAYFIARQPLLGRILEDLRRGDSAQHHLLIGTRGMGKTTLLKRLRFAIEDDDALSKGWLGLTFPEEQYNVARLSDLYLNCIDALSDALEDRGEGRKARELDAAVAAINGQKEEERSRRALELLLGAADSVGTRLVLLLDNVDILFDRLKAQAWALRELLSRESRVVLVGASASHPEMTYTYGAAFYDFFKVHELRGLPEDEARQLILHLADLRGAVHVRRLVESEPARLRTLHTLSGGNPRTMVLLYFVLAQSTEGDVRTDLERLLDHITPLYKARIEALSDQAQKIVDAVAVHWHPITAAETAAAAQIEVGKVSSQITRLVRDGVLERAPTPEGTTSAYQVAERLLNIWYLMRQSRRVRQRLVWLVEFLRMFYGSQELASHARLHLAGGAPTDAVETEQAGRDALRLSPESLDAAHPLACILVRLGKWDEPADLMARVIEHGDPELLENAWSDIVRFFAECVRAGRAAAGMELLDKTGFGERWLPLRAALAATLEGRESLLRIAPELRAPAERIHDSLVASRDTSASEEAPRRRRT